jgi:hypothetical protein
VEVQVLSSALFGSGEGPESGGRLGSDERTSALVEADEAECAGQIRVGLLELIERAKCLDRIDDMCEHAPVSLVD